MARFYPEIIDLTKSPATSSEPIFVNSDSDNSVTLHAPCPKDRQDKDRSRRRKREVDSTEDGELLEISTPTLKIGETQNAKTVQKHDGNARLSGKYDMKPEEHRQRHERKHRRRDDYSRDPSPRETHRSHSPVPHFPPSGVSPSFFVDVNPAPLPTMDSSRQPPRADESSKLLLPAHVSVFGSADGSVPVEILPPSNLPSNDDYIQYLDYDDSKVPGLVRYFDETVDDMKPTRFMCKNCGVEGEHKTPECPVKICLTCGARDEHSTRSCPISKTCFSCGMKGHINRTCPNRYAGAKEIDGYDDCDRCGSEIHKTNECPTLWRIYEYLADNDREGILLLREEKRKLGLGQGGEGYIASEEWCYNCGDYGHLGDDCNEVPHVSDIPGEPSAFSLYNTMSGPFDPGAEIKPSSSRRRREPRDWEPESQRFNTSGNVGEEGRKKERARMEKKAKQQEADDDPHDWFGNSRDIRNRGPDTSSHGREGKGPPSGVKKLSVVVKDTGRRFQPPSSILPTGPRRHASLLDRIESEGLPSPSGSKDRHSSKRRSGGRDDRDVDKHDRRHGTNSGPRYKGGYSR